MKIDSHQHFWDYVSHADDYVWMSDEQEALRRNYLPSDLEPLLQEVGYAGTIAVQAREMKAETEFLLGLAQAHPIIKGIVGWLDLCSPTIEAELATFSGEHALKGLRMLIHDRPDPDFAISDPHIRGVALLERYRLTYDLLLKPLHLSAAIRLVDQLPNQRFVVDHIAKPPMDGSSTDQWRDGIRAIAERPNVWCKLSGIVMQRSARSWRPSDFHPYLDVVVEAFGPERCMIGSDWPVCTGAADYKQTMGIVEDWCSRFSQFEQDAILGKTCSQFYGIEGARND
jgi:L-fuconolactonase